MPLFIDKPAYLTAQTAIFHTIGLHILLLVVGASLPKLFRRVYIHAKRIADPLLAFAREILYTMYHRMVHSLGIMHADDLLHIPWETFGGVLRGQHAVEEFQFLEMLHDKVIGIDARYDILLKY